MVHLDGRLPQAYRYTTGTVMLSFLLCIQAEVSFLVEKKKKKKGKRLKTRERYINHKRVSHHATDTSQFSKKGEGNDRR